MDTRTPTIFSNDFTGRSPTRDTGQLTRAALDVGISCRELLTGHIFRHDRYPCLRSYSMDVSVGT